MQTHFVNITQRDSSPVPNRVPCLFWSLMGQAVFSAFLLACCSSERTPELLGELCLLGSEFGLGLLVCFAHRFKLLDLVYSL